MSKQFVKSLLVAVLLAVHAPGMAEDTDLFVGADPATTDVPNVLIVVDNTANWNDAFPNEKAALVSVFDSLPENKFRIGLMLYSESGGGNGNPGGAYVRAALRLMNATNRPLYSDMVGGLSNANPDSDKGSGRSLGLAMAESYRYYSAGAAYAGHNKVKRDYPNNTISPDSAYSASNAVYALSGNAFASSASSTYVNPVTSGCQKNFIIYIGNVTAGGNVTKDNTNDNNASRDMLSAAGGSTAEIPLSPSGFADNYADEWARYMKQSPQGIVTYTVDVDPGSGGNGEANTALLRSMARVSGGKYFAVSSGVDGGSEIANALKSILSEIQSVNSVFASVSLPVSVNTQGTYLNQVYIGMFRPDENSLPRWAGNLKQYKLGFVDNTLKLLDAANTSAINSNTGFITECARSFWTPSTTDNYWSFHPQGACLAVANSDASNSPDGNIVEKGAQAYMLRSTTARTVKTCDSSCSATLADFDADNAAVSKAALGDTSMSDADRTALIDWARGLDIDDEPALVYGADANLASSTLMRPSAHGDVVHSRPVAINYGTDASPQVVVFYGGNDGVLRAVNGNRSASIGAAVAGSELWSFMPPEFYPNLKRLRDNSPAVSYPDTPTVGAVPKAYGFDGPVTAYTAGGASWIYAAMRRGGRAIYAFDVSTPASPALKWKRGCPNAGDDDGCSTDFEGIGQTWSSPKVLNASGHDSGNSPLLIVGGGYDTCEDFDALSAGGANHSCDGSSKGNKIYLLDADTGDLLNTFDTLRGVVADITVVPDSNGLATYAYAADLGGNVYRISGATANAPIGATAPDSWTITRIASLGCDTAATCTANRKFMFAPDVVVDGSTNILLLGSGDREKPLNHYAAAADVANHFFMLKDQPTSATWLSSENATCGANANVICRDSLVSIAVDAASPAQSAVDLKKGWYLELTSTEQVVTSAITVFGVVTFSSHQPAVTVAGQCSNLGTARVYNIEYGNAASTNEDGLRYENIAGGGLPPSPVAGMVTLDDGTTVPFIIGADGDSPLEGGEPPTPAAAAQPKAKVYWNIEQ